MYDLRRCKEDAYVRKGVHKMTGKGSMVFESFMHGAAQNTTFREEKMRELCVLYSTQRCPL
jgi:hypothetical protein